MNQLSDIAEAIRNYKLNAEGGYEEWAKVSCSEDYRMYVPSMGFDVTGADEVKEVIFGWLTDIEARQELDGLSYIERPTFFAVFLTFSFVNFTSNKGLRIPFLCNASIPGL